MNKNLKIDNINVLSLFDGMSCGQIALDRAGIKVNNYFASEIDKYAIQVAKHNYPNTKHIGSVVDVKGSDLPKIDLLIGGSPCQGFSFAGKQLNFDDPRSKLFFEFVRLKNECNPTYFLLENVKMKKEYQDIITEHLGVEPIEINSNLLSAQNRKRLYWTNIPNISMPKDKGILLKDIVHENESLNTILNGNYAEWFAKNAEFQLSKKYCSLSPDKAITMTARQYASWNGNYWFEILSEYIVPFDKTLQILDKEIQSGKVGYFRKDSQANRVYYIHDKAITLTGEAGGGAAKMGQYLFGNITKNEQQLLSYVDGELRVSQATKLGYDIANKGDTINFSLPNSKTRRGRVGKGKANTLDTQCNQGVYLDSDYLFGCITPDRVEKRQNGQRFN
jgi:DNA (cytosine-5)-methyltransferase 3A